MEQSPSEKLTGAQIVKKFPHFMESEYYLPHSLSWARSIQSMPLFHFLKTHFNITSHLCLGLTSCVFPSGIPPKTGRGW